MTVAVRHLVELALHTLDGGRQFPVLEGRAITQGVRFASKNSDIVQGVVDTSVAPESAVVLAHDFAVLPELDALGIDAHLDRASDGPSVHRIPVVVEPHEASLGRRRRHCVAAVERSDIRNQALALGFEHVLGRSILEFRVGIGLRPGHAAVLEPCVELGVALESGPRHKEPPPYDADLVLDLLLLPAGCWRACDRIDEIVTAHLLEAPVVGSVAPNEDRVDRRLHVVVDAPRKGAAEESEGFVVGVEDHLLRLARIGPNEQHPAVTETNVSDLHRGRDPIDENDLMAPVELVSLARVEGQGDVCRGRNRPPFLTSGCRIPPDGVVAAVIASGPQLLENPDQGQPFAFGLQGIRRKHLVQLIGPRPDLRQRLNGPLVSEFGGPGPDHLAHGIPRDPGLAADLLDLLLLLKIRPPDLRSRLHNQHPTLCSPIASGP